MAKKITVAVIGCGDFACNFVPLFQAHPYVEKVYVCDIIPERAREYSQRFGVEIIDTFENAIADSKITAVAIFTQRHLARTAGQGGAGGREGRVFRGAHGCVRGGMPGDCRNRKENRQNLYDGRNLHLLPLLHVLQAALRKGDFGTFV